MVAAIQADFWGALKDIASSTFNLLKCTTGADIANGHEATRPITKIGGREELIAKQMGGDFQDCAYKNASSTPYRYLSGIPGGP